MDFGRIFRMVRVWIEAVEFRESAYGSCESHRSFILDAYLKP